jgi:hypothetical protein
MLSSALEISSPIWITNSGITISNLQVKVADNANCPAIIIGTPNTEISNVTLINVCIDGNRTNQTREIWKQGLRNNGIFVQNADNVAVVNATIRGCRSGGIVCEKVTNFKVSHLISENNEFDGIAIYETTNSFFSYMSLNKNLAAGISMDNWCKNNVFRDCSIAENDLGIFMRNSRGNFFHDFYFNKNRHGVFIAQVDSKRETACVDNVFFGIPKELFRINDSSCTNNLIFP